MSPVGSPPGDTARPSLAAEPPQPERPLPIPDDKALPTRPAAAAPGISPSLDTPGILPSRAAPGICTPPRVIMLRLVPALRAIGAAAAASVRVTPLPLFGFMLYASRASAYSGVVSVK